MKVSFLVTYFNQEEYVNESIQSILNIEKPFEWEILVGDDGSSDGTTTEVKRYVDRFPNNIKLYIMLREKNKKYDSVKRVSENRLYLLERATGDLFCVLDGDDYYCDTAFVREAVELFERDRDLSIISFGYEMIGNDFRREKCLLPAAVRGHVKKSTYIRSFYIHAGACVYKKYSKRQIEHIKKIGYFDDNDIVLNSLNYGEMYNIGRVIYAYRQIENSLYNSMDTLEKAVLNVQGMDVDLNLMGNEYRNDIIRRYIGSFHIMYGQRKDLEKKMGEEKYQDYRDAFRKIQGSVGYEIMTYDKLPLKERKILIKINMHYRIIQMCNIAKKMITKVLKYRD